MTHDLEEFRELGKKAITSFPQEKHQQHGLDVFQSAQSIGGIVFGCRVGISGRCPTCGVISTIEKEQYYQIISEEQASQRLKIALQQHLEQYT